MKKIEINAANVHEIVRQAVDEEIMRRRRRLFQKIIICILFVPFAIWAASIAIPNKFNDGDTLSASKLNDNFDALITKINVLDGQFGKRLGTYCGKTALTYTGATVGGYTGAKTKCQTACANTNAHMCTAKEIVVSLQEGLTLDASTWFATGIMAGSHVNEIMNDCYGWTLANGAQAAVAWAGTNADRVTCNTSQAIACCL